MRRDVHGDTGMLAARGTGGEGATLNAYGGRRMGNTGV